MEKGPDAFRTISEVAEDLDLPQHVLRFWETRFTQIRPLKRGGGRRYYRPDDVELLRGIRHLLYGEGYTIRGVQRILKDEGPRYVQAIWRDVQAEEHERPDDDFRNERTARALRDEPVDSDYADTMPEEPPARGRAFSGILNLLPVRQKDVSEEPAARRSRRQPETEPDYMELPLLSSLEPQREPVRREPSHHSEAPHNAAPVRPAEPREVEPPLEPLPAAVSRHTGSPTTGDARPAFPFRAIAPEEEPYDEPDHLHAHQRPVATTVPPVTARPAMAPVTASPSRETVGVRENEVPPRSRLSREDIQRLQAALYELQDCRRLLDGARDEEG